MVIFIPLLMGVDSEPLLVRICLFPSSNGAHRVQHGRIRSENVGWDFNLAEVDAFRFPVCVVELVSLGHLGDGFLQATTCEQGVSIKRTHSVSGGGGKHGGCQQTWNAHQNPLDERRPRNSSAAQQVSIRVAQAFPWRDAFQMRRLLHGGPVLSDAEPGVAGHSHRAVAPVVRGRMFNDVVTILSCIIKFVRKRRIE